MVKKTLIALALVALLATSVHAAQGSIEWFFLEKTGDGGHAGVKVDGKDNPEFRWPYEISYKSLDICTIPIKMKVGMFVQIYECSKKKIVLDQVDCTEVGKGSGDYPCYKKCITLQVRSNFEVKLGTSLTIESDLIANGDYWRAYFDNTDVVAGDGANHDMKLCVEAWSAQLFNEMAGDEVHVGTVTVTVKPN